jgi:hypothetical protein
VSAVDALIGAARAAAEIRQRPTHATLPGGDPVPTEHATTTPVAPEGQPHPVAEATEQRDQAVVDFERAAAAAIITQRLDRDELVIDGGEWIVEGLDGDEHSTDEVLLTHQSGRQIRAQVAVTVIDGDLS